MIHSVFFKIKMDEATVRWQRCEFAERNRARAGNAEEEVREVRSGRRARERKRAARILLRLDVERHALAWARAGDVLMLAVQTMQ